MVQLGQRNSDAVAEFVPPHGATRKELATVLNQHTPTPENQQEEWRPVVGYEGLYEVSDLGRVRSLRISRVMSPGRGEERYPHLILYRDKQPHIVSVHILVARAFLGPAPEGMEVHH